MLGRLPIISPLSVSLSPYTTLFTKSINSGDVMGTFFTKRINASGKITEKISGNKINPNHT
ncbi:hypothetical protein SAMD00020551_1610 [Mesobacillus selenatarsenatis SF-1]|uniref:Uncharacterized protein n=1 Tax=Mesobacillus selenatarsenatis (strain DSM 18680 / JCM 14380 / FERM P-15431 / SF-1) TaxID=1321606 RepID=A0A0A8X5S3_MESS1|nr:hypothetical protein SAMD00020551_1610 [Mesobacillus selenatarsenatis SF-1]